MEVNKLENVMNQLFPVMTGFVTLIGILIVLGGGSIAIWKCIKEKRSLKEVQPFLFSTFCTGTLLVLSGVILNFIAGYEIDYSSYKRSIPLGYIITLIVFVAGRKMVKQNEKRVSENIDGVS